MHKTRIWIGLAIAVGMMAPVMAKEPSASAGGPFQLARMARTSAPGLHIRVVDASGAAVYPLSVAVEYDSGAPVAGKVTAEGFTAPVANGRKVRAVTLGALEPSQKPQRFDVDPASANVLLFRR
jgi:hypothetical protein